MGHNRLIVEQIDENVVYFRQNVYKMHCGVLRYADLKKTIGNHVIGPRVPTQNWGLKLGYALF